VLECNRTQIHRECKINFKGSNNNNNNNNNNNTFTLIQPHFNICKEIGVQLDKKHWYKHVPKSVEINQGGKVTIPWVQQVQADRIVTNNKPDIIIRDNEKGNMHVNRCHNFMRQTCD
jgi:hypothetical protein